jgi:hypothetical protein
MSSSFYADIFQGDPSKLQIHAGPRRLIWFLQDAWTEIGGCRESGLGRLNVDGEVEIVATTEQDGMIKAPRDYNMVTAKSRKEKK